MPVVLVSGAASGLGKTFVQTYAREPGTRVLAIDRQQCNFSTLPNTTSFVVDLTCESSIQDFAIQIQDEAIDSFVHSAGIRGLVPQVEHVHPNNVAACETMQVMDLETLLRAFQINAAGTFLLIRALLPNFRRSHDAKVIIMSSRMGSVGNNEVPRKDAGSAYAYRASKAALNTIVRSFAADVPEVCFVLCHPGRVETNLVKCKEEGAITAQESVDDVMALIKRWGKGDSGKFYDRFGERIEW